MAKPDDNDAMESCIGLAVATAVESMPVGLTGGSRYRVYPAQRGEGRLGVEALGVTPSSDHEGRRRVGSYAEDADQGWGCGPDEPIQFGLQILDLLTELTVAAGKRSKSVLGSRRGIVQATRTEAGVPRCQGTGGETIERFAELGRGRDNQGLHSG